MKVLELFSGSGIMSQTFREYRHEIFTIDNNPEFKPQHTLDIMKFTMRDLPHKWNPDVIWASPPCKCFSVASIGTHWKGGKKAYIPKTDATIESLKLLEHTIWLISTLKPKYWFIENPRGVMRKVIDRLFAKHGLQSINNQVIRHTVTYCQYGDTRMKPTDIWTNNSHWKPRPKCKNGNSCHVRAPRGAKTGTQGLKGAYERGKLPKQLCVEIVKACQSQ